MDIRSFAGKDVVIQLKEGEKWFVWMAPPKQANSTLPELVRAPDPNGNAMPIPMPFLQGTVTESGGVLVDTGSGGKLLVTLAEETIASVTQLIEAATVQERSNLIVPGN